MKRLLLLAFLFLILASIFNGQVLASSSPIPSNSPSPKPESTYELFWPLSPGRTIDSKLFFLKRIKEDFKSKMLIGSPAKADYEVTLGTKRLIEAEKLFDEKKEKYAVKSLQLAFDKTEKTLELVKKSKKGGENLPSVKDNMLNQIDNLKVFLPRLTEKASSDEDRLIEDILVKIKEIEVLLKQ